MRNSRSLPRGLGLVTALVTLMALVLPATPAIARPEDGRIVIGNNSEFDSANGVRSGRGTKNNPYVIEGWDVHELTIHDTDRYVVIRNNIIGRLTLNWIGDRVTVVNNKVGDLRVNENVKRTGAASSGVISHNRFGSVGQLRHWDGVFSRNIVGAPRDSQWNDLGFWGSHIRAVNFDGFNGSSFVRNTIYGYVEARLHGHHHSSGFGGSSHYHGADETHEAPLTHMRRHHRVRIAHNKIYSGGPYGLIYTDSNHAGNDRTATSETNEALNDPHTHLTKVAVLQNELVGSGIVVNIFNADDSKHLRTRTGHFTIRGNDIRVKEYRHSLNAWDDAPAGIEVRQARDLHLNIADNTILGPAGEQSPSVSDSLSSYTPAGIRLWDIEKAWIHLMGNQVTNRQVGIYARQFRNVEWWIHGLKTEGVDTEVDYDNSSSSPHKGP